MAPANACDPLRGFAPQPLHPEATEKVPITAFLFIFSVTLFKNYRKRTLKILRSEVFQWPPPPPHANSFNLRGIYLFVVRLWIFCVFSHFFNFIAFFTIHSLINLYAKQLFLRTHRCGNAGNQPPRRSGYQTGRPPESAERRRFQIIFFEGHKGINLPAESFYLCCNRQKCCKVHCKKSGANSYLPAGSLTVQFPTCIR